jgi:hypothetical protein
LSGIREEQAMANKPEFVDLISSATRQKWRRSGADTAAAATTLAEESFSREKRRLSNWPPARFAQWRLENLTPWKFTLKSWSFKDWD